MKIEARVEALVALLLDPSAPLEARDDASIDLGDLAERGERLCWSRQLRELWRQSPTNPTENAYLYPNAGEALAEVWVAGDQFDLDTFGRLMPEARAEVPTRCWSAIVPIG